MIVPARALGRQEGNGAPATPHSRAIRSRPPLTLLEEGPSRLRLSWAFPAGSLTLDTDGSGRRVVRAPGFGLRPSGGDLQVPYRIEFVAIPEGVVPKLSRPAMPAPRQVSLESLPAKAARGRTATGSQADAFRAPGPNRPMALHEFPVSLGSIGYFRDQRFVEVRVSPVRATGSGESLEVAEEPVAILSWDPSREKRSATLPQDPLAENAYRRLFPNYEQGKSYRVRRLPEHQVEVGGTSATA